MKEFKLNKTTPPKSRSFLGLVETLNDRYWDIFFWAKKEEPCYCDSALDDMPHILGWVDLPDIGKVLSTECDSCLNGYNGTNGNGYQPCNCNGSNYNQPPKES